MNVAHPAMTAPISVVVPTIGRPTLSDLLRAVASAAGRLGVAPAQVLVVDDRRRAVGPLALPATPELPVVRVLSSGGRGPASARNVGWRCADSEWIAFLDDDVLPSADWLRDLTRDLDGLGPAVAGSQGRLRVPLRSGRRPTDAERGTRGLETSRWITADMAYRRTALAAVGGFDERFPRAFREDADLALRVQAAGWQLVAGNRSASHPIRPPGPWASVRAQRGNQDDALMARLHGRDWHHRADAAVGRRSRHLLITLAGVTALACAAGGHRRAAALAGGAWACGTAEFAVARIAPGPRSRAEVTTMVATSVAIPPLAAWHWTIGWVRHRFARPWEAPSLPEVPAAPGEPSLALVLFDRDGTLVHDIPYNGDPDLVEPMPGARAALDRLRAAGVRVGMVTNQSGVADGRISMSQVDAVNERVCQQLGPFDVVLSCPHNAADACGCRKPAPGMIDTSCQRLGVHPSRCAVVGDIAGDLRAARAAGARGILVPTDGTNTLDIAYAETVAGDLAAAVDLLLDGG